MSAFADWLRDTEGVVESGDGRALSELLDTDGWLEPLTPPWEAEDADGG